jgi:hypothetical protein
MRFEQGRVAATRCGDSDRPPSMIMSKTNFFPAAAGGASASRTARFGVIDRPRSSWLAGRLKDVRLGLG